MALMVYGFNKMDFEVEIKDNLEKWDFNKIKKAKM